MSTFLSFCSKIEGDVTAVLKEDRLVVDQT